MRLTFKIWMWLAVITGLVLVMDLTISYRQLTQELRKEAEFDARSIYGIMMATRRVYQQAFVDSGLPVNSKTLPFLPAHSFLRISRDFANWNRSGIRFNNVSDRPRNPANQADRHELLAMDWFRGNPKATERLEDIVDDSGTDYLLYAAPIWIEPSCLRCHDDPADAPYGIREAYPDAAWGYKVGELRGLVSIKIPMAKFEERRTDIWQTQLAKALGGYAVLFLTLGWLVDRIIIRRLTRLQGGVERIAAGDYGTRLQPKSQDEICALASSVNRMAAAIQDNIADRDRTAARVERLVFWDTLTGLPNRAMLLDRLAQTLALAARRGGQSALILLNIDRFKTINDACGHETGDLLLLAFGGRLKGLLREGDTCAHLAGDEFAILLPDLGSRPGAAGIQALTVAEKIHRDLLLPFGTDSRQDTALTASLGIALLPAGTDDTPQEVLRRADTALHRAKEAGGHQTAFFDPAMGHTAEQRFAVERDLRRGLAAGELRLHLQSQVDAGGGLVGAEALVRWQHPERGLLSPGVFIPIAEESDLIVGIGAWVLAEACRLLAGPELAGLRLSVNVSPRQFRHPGFVAWVRDLLATSGTDPRQLTLEVTESLMIGNVTDVAERMGELTALGIQLSVDDFGTGYSSLAYLKRLPLSEIKIDQSFVQDAPTDPADAALVDAMLAIAGHLGLTVVAEGIETAEQADFFNDRGPVIRQGYLYGRPEPAEAWLARRQQPSGA
jgi:diguanylate cyclase (GGDEF)-like protein